MVEFSFHGIASQHPSGTQHPNFNKVSPMSSGRSVTHVPGLDRSEPRPPGAVSLFNKFKNYETNPSSQVCRADRSRADALSTQRLLFQGVQKITKRTQDLAALKFDIDDLADVERSNKMMDARIRSVHGFIRDGSQLAGRVGALYRREAVGGIDRMQKGGDENAK